MEKINKNKSAISTVVATLLILTITIISIVSFNLWSNNFIDTLLVKNDKQLDSYNDKSLELYDLIKGTLYLRDDSSKKEIKFQILSIDANGINCNITKNITNKISKINLNNCLEKANSRKVKITLQTKNQIKSKFFFNENYHGKNNNQNNNEQNNNNQNQTKPDNENNNNNNGNNDNDDNNNEQNNNEQNQTKPDNGNNNKHIMEIPTGFTGITTCQELQNIKDDVTKKYILMSNINCLESKNYNSGSGFEPIETQSSTKKRILLEGNNYSINNLYINKGSSWYASLFYDLKENLIIQNLEIINANITGSWYVAGLVGTNNGYLENIKVLNSSINGDWYVANIIGENKGYCNKLVTNSIITGQNTYASLIGENSGTVSNSYAFSKKNNFINTLIDKNEGAINQSYVIGNIKLTSYCGGLVKRNSGEIHNSYVIGNITSKKYNGGFVGENRGKIYNSYFVGDLESEKYTGGFLYKNYGRIYNSYFNENKHNLDYEYSSYGNINKKRIINSKQITNEEIFDKNFFINTANWDENIWILENGKYPKLR